MSSSLTKKQYCRRIPRHIRKLKQASVEIALVCGLKVRVGCQDRLCVNSDADETLA